MAPYNAPIHRIDEDAIDTPDRWAMTWRGFKRKYGEAAVVGAPSDG